MSWRCLGAGLVAKQRGQNRAFVGVVGGDHRDNPPPVNQIVAVGQTQHLLDLAGDDQNGGATRRKVCNRRVDALACAHIHTPGWVRSG